MKIEKLIQWFIAVLLVATPIALAISSPMPVNGIVRGNNVAGQAIVITNLRTGVIMETKTTTSGEFLVDWSNSIAPKDGSGKIINGDKIQVSIKGCSSASCRKEATYFGQDHLFVELIAGELCPACNCPVPPAPNAGLIVGGLVALIALIGGGMKVYKNKLGNIVVQHSHKGYLTYHDANTSHSDLKFKHRRWKDDPVGCAEDVKKINDLGGM